MHFSVILLIILIIISNLQLINSRGGRGGGGSRGGGSRGGSRYSGGSRSGFRSGSSTKIGSSSRFNSWSRYNGFSPSFRYRSSSYSTKSRGISMGLIIVSHRTRSNFIYYHESSYNDISICYNEFSLYDRNLSQSPWFVCPWDDLSYRYCCGDEIQEKCCRYFDRPGHLAGLIIGFLIFFVLLAVTCHFCCKHRKSKTKSGQTLVFFDTNQALIEEKHDEYITPMNVQNPPYPTNETSPPYPTASEEAYKPYPVDPPGMMPQPGYGSPPQPGMMPQPGYGSPPQPGMMPQPGYFPPLQQAPQTGGYNDSGMQYPLIPPENPPPSYSDVTKNTNA